MKKLLLLISFLFILTGIEAQVVLFGHVNKELFTTELTADRTVRANGVMLWSLDAVVQGAEITYDKEASLLKTSFLNGVGAAFGYKFYKLVNDVPVSTFGINVALLTKITINDIVDTRMKIALLANVYNFTLGPVFTFKDNQIGLLVGTTIQF